MKFRRLAAASCAILLLAGAGCSLNQKIGWDLPLFLRNLLPSADPLETTKALVLKEGLRFTVRPSLLGLTGTLDEALGRDVDAIDVQVLETENGNHTLLAWMGDAATGTLQLDAYADAHAMLLPAFWMPGISTAEHNGGLWLSRAAYGELMERGETEWRLGLAENAFSALSKALDVFNTLSIQLSGSATATQVVSPFTIKKTGVVQTFPLMVDRRIVFVQAVQASSWFADFLVLDNPDNPLILKVNVHPVASPALKALESAHVRWNELGYEITSISRP